MRKELNEFKEFVLRGNIVELAVAFVLGVAFSGVIGSLVGSLLMPLVAMIIGKPDFSGLSFAINDAVFSYGSFITTLVNFVAIAAVLFFLVVKPLQALSGRHRAPEQGVVSDEERRHQELLAALRARV